MLNRYAFIMLPFILSACMPHSHYNIRQVNSEHTDFQLVSFQFQAKENSYLSVDKHYNSEETLELSQAITSAHNATPIPPGTSPGQAAAAGLVATIMISSFNQKSTYTQAQRKVNGLRKVLNILGGSRLLNQLAEHNFAHFSLYPTVDEARINEKNKQPLTIIIHIEPEIIFSNNLSKLRVKTNISMNKPDMKTSFYSNTFEYWCEPVLPEAGESERERFWSDNNADNLKQYLTKGMKSIRGAFEAELKNIVLGSVDSDDSYRTIRYLDNRGIHYIRGVLLEQSELRFLVRDLRGNIKSIYGELQ